MSILAEILAHKVGEVAAARQRRSLAELERCCSELGPTRDFAAALRRPAGAALRVIAEIKRASPSAGAIRPAADPAPIAREYAAAGAAALSVLTDRDYFDGRLEFLSAARAVVELPLLRKDFVIDPYQVVEARAGGADAILLIVAALDDALLGELLERSRSLGLAALVEVHDQREAGRAVVAGAEIIGVNHRNLADFTIDMSLSARLRDQVPGDCLLVGESGIKSRADVATLSAAGVDAILVGERLMRAPSPGDALAELMEEQ